MDSQNLSTCFAPSIIHKRCAQNKSSQQEYEVETLERAEERKDIIDIVKDMIDNCEEIFQVSTPITRYPIYSFLFLLCLCKKKFGLLK